MNLKRQNSFWYIAFLSIFLFLLPIDLGTPTTENQEIRTPLVLSYINNTYAQGPAVDPNSLPGLPSSGSGGGNTFSPQCSYLAPTSWPSGCLTPAVIALGGAALTFAGALLDLFMALTINTSLLKAPYISEIWGNLRDFANMTFILGMIVVGLLMIVGSQGVAGITWRKTLVRLIIVALLINFSLFFSRVIIDAGNIVGMVFYSEIIKVGGQTTNPVIQNQFALSPESALTAIASAPGATLQVFNVSSELVKPLQLHNLLGAPILNSLSNDGENQGFLFMFNVVFLIIAFLGAYSFFVASFLFLSRTITLIVMSLVSPIAMVTFFLPHLDHLGKKWLRTIFNASFCLACYLFLIYILIIVINSGFVVKPGQLAATGSGGSLADSFIGTAIKGLVLVSLIMGILSIANKQAKKMCESDGGGIGSFMAKAVGGAAVAVTGGAAGFAARSALGGLGHRLATRGGKWAGDGDSATKRFVGQLGQLAGDKLESANFGLSRGYKEQLSEKGKARKNTYDRIYSQTKEDERNRLMAEGKSKQEAEKEAKVIAERKAQAYINSISNKKGGTPVQAVIDFVAAGGVKAGKEAARQIEVEAKADSDSKEKTAKLRDQQIAIERDKTQANQTAAFQSDRVIEELKGLDKILDEEKLEASFKSTQMKEFENMFRNSHSEVTGYGDDGTPKTEMTDKAKKIADTNWNQFDKQIRTIFESANTKVAQQEALLKDSRTNIDSFQDNAASINNLVSKLQKAEQNGGLSIADMSDSEKQAAQNIGLSLEKGELRYNADNLQALQRAGRQVGEKLEQAQKETAEISKEIDRIVSDRNKKAEKAMQTATNTIKDNNKAVADTSRATLNARLENITEERAVRQENVENLGDGEIIGERGFRQEDLDDPLTSSK